MLKSNLVSWGVFGSLFCFGHAAFAGESFHTSKLKVNHDFQPTRVNYFKTRPVHLPRYDEFIRLPHKAQLQYLKAFQLALVELEKESGSHSSDGVTNWVLDQLFYSANAGTAGPEFCINLGVVKPIEQCESSLGTRMHDFDTRSLLSDLGPAATHCQPSEKPCSPVFGFDQSGSLFCTNTNLTRSCELKSQAKGTIPLADVLTTCSLPSAVQTAQVNCAEIKKFFDAQTLLVEKHCKGKPDSFASSILRKQMEKVRQEVQINDAIVQADDPVVPDAREVAGLVGAANEIAAFGTTSPTCPDPVPAGVPASVQGPAPASVVDCTSKDFKPGGIATFYEILDQLPDDFQSKDGCNQIVLPNQSIVRAVTKNHDHAFSIQPPSVSGKSSPVISISEEDALALDRISNALVNRFKVAPKDLLSSYLPVSAKADAGLLDVPVENNKVEKLRTHGWTSADGSELRYDPGIDGTFTSDNGQRVWAAGVKLKGAQKEDLVQIVVPGPAPDSPDDKPNPNDE